jgi:hypothetical protein
MTSEGVSCMFQFGKRQVIERLIVTCNVAGAGADMWSLRCEVSKMRCSRTTDGVSWLREHAV